MARVLLVSGEQHLLQLLEDKFVEEGFEVATAHDGDSLTHALDSEPELIVLEQRLVDEHGVPLHERLKASEALRAIPLILLTVHDGHASTDPSVAMPFRPRQLIALAREAL